MLKHLKITLIFVSLPLLLLAANLPCCDCPKDCDYPFFIDFDSVKVDDAAGGPADWHWTLDVLDRRGNSAMEDQIVKDSSTAENPIVIVSRYDNFETEQSWMNVTPLPALALLNSSGTDIVGALIMMVVWPFDATAPGVTMELGDVNEDLAPEAAAFLYYGPVDSYGQIACLVRISGSCSGKIKINDYKDGLLSAHIEGANYAIYEDDIRSLMSDGTSLCEAQ